MSSATGTNRHLLGANIDSSTKKLAGRDKLAGLQMSDYWFLSGLILALSYVADPLDWNLERIGVTKHLPLIITLCGVLLINTGSWLFCPIPDRPRKHWSVVQAGLPLLLLSIWIIVGSLYARKIGVNSTFLIVGLYMLFAFMTARVIMISNSRETLIHVYLTTAALFSAFMIIRMIFPFGGVAVNYHEMEALIVPLAVYYALKPAGNRHWQAALVLFFLLGGLVFRKNTGFIVLFFTLAYIWFAEWQSRFRESQSFRLWTATWVMLILVAGIAAAGYIAAQRDDVMPSGNTDYRMLTYEKAWQRFLDSPLIGTGFVGAAAEKFTGYEINAAKGVLATHSDILDMAAHGGALAILLWLWGYVRIARTSFKHVLRGQPRTRLRAAAHTFACMSFTSIFVYAFNPILLQPARSLLMWSQLGMLLGIALYLAHLAAHEPSKGEQHAN